MINRIYKIVFKQVEQEILESLGPPSAGPGYPPSEASAAGGSMRGVATPDFLLLLLFSMLKSC